MALLTDRSARRGASARWFAIAALLSIGAVAIALVSQHAFGMEPCAWCVFSRLVFVVIAVVALLGLAWRRPLATRLLGLAGVLLAAAGIVASLWQHFVAARAGSCNQTLADRVVAATTLHERLPAVFEARASCAEAAVDLAGVPYDFWAAAAFVLVGVTMARAMSRAR